MTGPKVHFVIPNEFANELAAIENHRLDEGYPYWLGGRFNWVAQTWLVLRQYREDLSIGSEPCANRINFSHSMTWRALGARRGEFRIGARADYPRLFDIDFEIVQNPAIKTNARQAYLPYWPVPGLRPRSDEREGILRMAYAGRLGSRNLDAALRHAIAEHPSSTGVEFVTIAPQYWHDMSAIDLLVAVRDFKCRKHYNKPPSKLFNAWFAGIPLIGGSDSAYSTAGRPGVDYIKASSTSEFFSAIARLREDSDFYKSIVLAGRERAPELSREAIAHRWLALLDGQIASTFATWIDPASRPLNRHYFVDLGLDAARRVNRILRNRLPLHAKLATA